MGNVVNSAVQKGLKTTTKGFMSKLDATKQTCLLLSSGQHALNLWKAQFVHKVHDKFSTLNGITATIHIFDNLKTKTIQMRQYLWRRNLNACLIE